MAAIKISTFGGIAPSVSDRSLPASLAAASNNLFSPNSEFQPLATDKVVAGVTLALGSKTLYKRQRVTKGGPLATEAQAWYSDSRLVSLVKGQIDDDLSERTYYTFDEAPIAQMVADTAIVKPLGVTPPAAAPSVAHTAVPKYTVDEDTAARRAIPLALRAAAISSATGVELGAGQATMVAGAVFGWLPHGALPALPTKTGEYAVCVALVNGLLSAKDQYLLDPALAGVEILYGGYKYWSVAVALRGWGYTVDATALATRLKAINNPDPDFVRKDTTGYTGATPTKQLAPDSVCVQSALDVQANYAVTGYPQAGYIADIDSAQTSVVTVVSTYSQAAMNVAGVQAFYASAPIVAEVNSHAAQYAKSIWLWVQNAVDADAGAWNAASVSSTLQTSIYNTVNTTSVIPSGVDGARYVEASLARAAASSVVQSYLTGAGVGNVIDPINALNTVLSMMDSTLTGLFVAGVSIAFMREKYPTLAPKAVGLDTKAAAIVQALADLRTATRRVTDCYTAKNADLEAVIANLFDAKGGIAESMPTPQAAVYDSRYYVTTLVTSWGEESAPSAPSSVAQKVDVDSDSCVVSAPSSANLTAEYVVGWRLYRSNSGSVSSAFQLVQGLAGEAGIVMTGGAFDYFSTSLTSYTDTRKADSLQEVLPSTTWLKPDARMVGLVGLVSGMMAGFFDNVLCFSEPYVPYAWPVGYQMTVKYPIVGMGAFGQSLLVLTRGNVYLVSGTDANSMSLVELPSNQTCSSARSIVPIENGVLYVSPDGICLADTSGVQLLTQGLITREIWQSIQPENVFAAYHEGVYYMRNSGTGGLCYALDLVSKKLTSLDLTASAFFVDKFTDRLYAAVGYELQAVFAGTGRRMATYKTGITNTGNQTPFAWLQVFSDFDLKDAFNQIEPVTLKWYGDGVLRYTATVTSREPVRMPSGRYLEHQFEITSKQRLSSVVFAGNTLELQQV